MTWIYEQATGVMRHVNAAGVVDFKAEGYSGHGRGLNDPDSQHLESVGPIPQGGYTIGAPYDSKRVGPFTLPLIPEPSTQTFGRDHFRCHGDKRFGPPNSASRGCIVLSREARERIHESCDNDLLVVSGRSIDSEEPSDRG